MAPLIVGGELVEGAKADGLPCVLGLSGIPKYTAHNEKEPRLAGPTETADAFSLSFGSGVEHSW